LRTHRLLETPLNAGAFGARNVHQGVHQCARVLKRSDKGPHRLWQLVRQAFVKVGHDVVGDDTLHAALKCGRADHEASPERPPNELDVVESERVQDRSARAMPVRGHQDVLVLKHAALSWSIERNNVVATPRKPD